MILNDEKIKNLRGKDPLFYHSLYFGSIVLYGEEDEIYYNTFALFAINQAIQGEVSVFSPLTFSPCLSKKCKSFGTNSFPSKLQEALSSGLIPIEHVNFIDCTIYLTTDTSTHMMLQ